VPPFMFWLKTTRAAGWRIEILFEHNPEGQTDLPGNGPDYLRDVIRMSEPGRQCGGFDIRFRVAASSDSECQIQNRPGILYLQVSLWF
jgi:hypothetical protein